MTTYVYPAFLRKEEASQATRDVVSSDRRLQRMEQQAVLLEPPSAASWANMADINGQSAFLPVVTGNNAATLTSMSATQTSVSALGVTTGTNWSYVGPGSRGWVKSGAYWIDPWTRGDMHREDAEHAEASETTPVVVELPTIEGTPTAAAEVDLVMAKVITRVGRPRLPHRRGISPQKVTRLAACLAGRSRRDQLRVEWRSHLHGETAAGLDRKDQLHAARGFLLASLRYRLADLRDAAWAPLDAVLRSRVLANLLVLGLPAVAAIFIRRYEGNLGVVEDGESFFAIGTGAYLLIQAGRRYRNVKPPEPKARRQNGDG